MDYVEETALKAGHPTPWEPFHASLCLSCKQKRGVIYLKKKQTTKLHHLSFSACPPRPPGDKGLVIGVCSIFTALHCLGGSTQNTGKQWRSSLETPSPLGVRLNGGNTGESREASCWPGGRVGRVCVQLGSFLSWQVRGREKMDESVAIHKPMYQTPLSVFTRSQLASTLFDESRH